MISHEHAQRIIEKAILHLEHKMDLEFQCEECGCSPITGAELATIFKYFSAEGVAGVEDNKPSAPAKPAIPAAFPVKNKSA